MTARTLSLPERCRGGLRRAVIAALAGAMAFVPPAQACTSFLLRTSDGGVVYGRTMEFGFQLTSEAIVLPRQFAFTATGGLIVTAQIKPIATDFGIGSATLAIS